MLTNHFLNQSIYINDPVTSKLLLYTHILGKFLAREKSFLFVLPDFPSALLCVETFTTLFSTIFDFSLALVKFSQRRRRLRWRDRVRNAWREYYTLDL